MPMVCPLASTNSIGPSLSRICAATSSATATRVMICSLVLHILSQNNAIGYPKRGSAESRRTRRCTRAGGSAGPGINISRARRVNLVVIRYKLMTSLRDYIAGILRWTAWANARVLDAATRNPESSTDALPIFSHIMAAEHIWLFRIDDAQPLLEVWPTLTWHECGQWLDENRGAFTALETSVSKTDLNRIVRFTNSMRVSGAMRTIDILTHVGTHGAYHRGQIAKIIGRSGGQVPLTDYFVYVRKISTAG